MGEAYVVLCCDSDENSLSDGNETFEDFVTQKTVCKLVHLLKIQSLVTDKQQALVKREVIKPG